VSVQAAVTLAAGFEAADVREALARELASCSA
jgi:hypothetical protein